jgi:transmembrane sensor
MNATTPEHRIALAAAEWYFRLQEAGTDPAEQAACATWRAADPRHEAAWAKAGRIADSFAGLPGAVALPALDRQRHPSAARRQAVKVLATLLVAAPAGWLAWQSRPARELLAEHRTATGERRQIVLADGSHIHLNTATALDVDYDDKRRLLRLRQGEILIDTAPDPNLAKGLPYRPFVVETAQGSVRALGTRFIVRQLASGSQVAVYAGAVEISPFQAVDHKILLAAGEQASFSATDTTQAGAADPRATDWTEGQLFVRNQRLADFLNELGRHRPGLLRCDPAVAELRISGAFQLRDTDAILNSLPEALPVKVVYRSRYWVTLTAPGS